MSAIPANCPAHAGRDDRKSAKLADANLAPHTGSRVVGSFFGGRDILRSPKVRQAGAAADMADLSKPGEISFFFLDGDLHRKRRAAVAGLFAPKTIVTRHQSVMKRTMDAIVAKLQRDGLGAARRAQLADGSRGCRRYRRADRQRQHRKPRHAGQGRARIRRWAADRACSARSSASCACSGPSANSGNTTSPPRSPRAASSRGTMSSRS